MPTKESSVKGIRLLDKDWEAVDAAAKALGMTRNEYMARLAKNATRAVSEVSDSDESIRKSDRTTEEEEQLPALS